MNKVVSFPRPPLLVIGCGNLTCGDDRAGMEFVRKLRPQSCAQYAAREMPQLSVDLLELFKETETILFVDAVETGAAPGTLHLVPLPYAGLQSRSLGKVSGHGWGLNEVLGLARSLGREIPRLALLGIELESVEPGEPISPAVKQALQVALENFPRLRTLLSGTADALTRPRSFAPGDCAFPGEVKCA
ncbi:MAG TPA: hydrogenase maturation protease [Terriglobales bacterium]|nr:hydrogenase maturation protease [Terriglobales bacterium]